MFLKTIAAINIFLCIVAMVFNPNQISALFVSICASVAMIYFADMCRNVAKIRFGAWQIHHELVRASEAARNCDDQQRQPDDTSEQDKAETKYDGINHPASRYEAVLKAERSEQR